MEVPIVSQGVPLDKAKIYEALFSLIDDTLFAYEPLVSDKEENIITQSIEILLSEKAHVNNNIFTFQNQPKIGIYTPDIGVYLRGSRNYFCIIEAKRLPTPKDKKRDEREYVIVNKEQFKGNGGIQRFKESKYAQKHSCSIMFGYIQDDNNIDHWLFKVNAWIMELNDKLWSNADCLTKYKHSKCYRLISRHKRADKTTITLHHYWIKL